MFHQLGGIYSLPPTVMDTTHSGKRGFGIVVVLTGCVFASPLLLALLRGHLANGWRFQPIAVSLLRIATLVLLASFSTYLICSGLRMLNPLLVPTFRFGWGKILVGSWMLLSQVSSHYHLAPEGPLPIFKPSNASQSVGMTVAGIVMCLVAVYLIFRGIREGSLPP